MTTDVFKMFTDHHLNSIAIHHIMSMSTSYAVRKFVNKAKITVTRKSMKCIFDRLVLFGGVTYILLFNRTRNYVGI